MLLQHPNLSRLAHYRELLPFVFLLVPLQQLSLPLKQHNASRDSGIQAVHTWHHRNDQSLPPRAGCKVKRVWTQTVGLPADHHCHWSLRPVLIVILRSQLWDADIRCFLLILGLRSSLGFGFYRSLQVARIKPALPAPLGMDVVSA